MNLHGNASLLYAANHKEIRMHHRLAKILDEKKKEVARLKCSMPFSRDNQRQSLRDFKAAISSPEKIDLIAEVKFASPSAGRIREKADPSVIGRIYQDAGAAAISLLTDQRFFDGDLAQLPRLKNATALPILRKDFIIDAIQIREAFFYGADAILLIARILAQPQLAEFIALCGELGLAPLTEVHSRDDLEKAVVSGAEIIGINNRDLDSFKIDMQTTFRLAPLVPAHCVCVSESGITGEEDITALKTADIQAVLIGSTLMRSQDLAGRTKKFVSAGKK